MAFFQPMPLSRRPAPFDHPEWIFELTLTDRKHELRRVLPKASASRMLYADHVERHGMALFQRVCEMDLEGIVAKHSFGPYSEETTWFKIKNRHYSQMEGREELFERERDKEPVAGWHCCELACAEIKEEAAPITT